MGNLIKWFTILVVWNYFPKMRRDFHVMSSRCTPPLWETTAKIERIISTGKTHALRSEAPSSQHASAIAFSAEPCIQNRSIPQHRQNKWCRRRKLVLGNSLLVYKSEFAVDRTAGDELSGFDTDVFGRVVGQVRVEAAHRHQAGQVWGFFLGVALWVQLAARPTPHVSSAVEGTVSVSVCGQKNK